MNDKPLNPNTASIDIARRLIGLECEALNGLATRLGEDFERAVEVLYSCHGKIIVTGLGKSGIAAKKLAATLASSNAPALFLHANEAVHGDMGVIRAGDAAVAISYSGETREVVSLIPHFKLLGVPVIAISGQSNSSLATAADVHLDVSVPNYDWPFGIIPTASLVASIAVGDALTIALLVRRGVKEEDFALLHPEGLLGRKMLVKVADLMHTGERLPIVRLESNMRNVLTEITSKMLGVACVLNDEDELIGIITDGDVRRLLERIDNPLSLTAGEAMTRHPKTIPADMLAAHALHIMEKYSITSLPVLNGDRRLIGLIHLHDILKLETVR